MDTANDDRMAREFRTFAAAVVHELRTPLSALAAEVDIALRRERPATAYRDAMMRIRTRITELTEFSGDLAWLGQPPEPSPDSAVACLESVLATIAQRSATTAVAIDRDITDVRVHGNEHVLTRGIWLLVQHALRYRLEESIVRIGVLRPGPADAHVSIDINTIPPQFAAGAWNGLLNTPASGVSAGDVLRLHAVNRIVQEVGGEIAVGSTDADGVTVRLRRA